MKYEKPNIKKNQQIVAKFLIQFLSNLSSL